MRTEAARAVDFCTLCVITIFLNVIPILTDGHLSAAFHGFLRFLAQRNCAAESTFPARLTRFCQSNPDLVLAIDFL